MVITRLQLIRRILRQIYGGQPSVDSNITDNFVNHWLHDAFAFAAKKNYTENNALEGVEFVNNSFYTTFSGLTLTTAVTEDFCYVFTLPNMPVGVGSNFGIGTVKFMDTNGNISQDAIPINMNQVGYFRNMKPIPNKILYWSEGNTVFVKSILDLTSDKAIVKMISSGDDTNLNSTINVPEDYFPDIVEYVKKQLSFERQMPRIPTNDGEDA
jgi:hypothetical protein